MSDARYRCTDCRAVMLASDRLIAPHPFAPDTTITGCPACQSAATLAMLCDVPSCGNQAGCGWPSPTGYRHTCGLHMDSGEPPGDEEA